MPNINTDPISPSIGEGGNMFKHLMILFSLVAVLSSPAYAQKMQIGFVEEVDATVEVPDVVRQNLKEAVRKNFVESGKFDVVDRTQKDVDRLFEEMKFSDERIGRVDVNDDKKAEYGKMSGMEYMVLVNINDFFSGEEASKFQQTDQGNKPVVRVGANVRLLNTSTGRIRLEKSLSAKRVARGASSVGDLTKKAVEMLAGKVSLAVMDEIYPIMIIQKTGDSAFINRGKDSSIAVGQEMNVFVAEQVLDEGTGETLDLMKEVGKVKVKNVSQKTAEVEIIEDFGVDKGCILKPVDQEAVMAEDIAETIEKKKNAEDW
jgi:hypothetical protein